jgi:hypothetical protein
MALEVRIKYCHCKIYCSVVYHFVLSAYSICYTTKLGLEYPLANRYPYSQLLAREK